MFISEIIILSSCFFAFFFCIFFIRDIMIYPSGTNEMICIANTIKSCAKTYLKRQYRTIFYVSIFLSFLIFLFLGIWYVFGFLIGAFFSAFIGYIGMLVSVNANVRVANAARIDGLAKALYLAFRSGSVTGLLVVSLGVLGIYSFYKFLLFFALDDKHTLNLLLALGFGSSLISIFARLGGGIFTKGADIGADLVGKLEIGVPEDDARNPAAIADNVGDNVGDCAGMAADLYETFCVTIIATMVLFSILCDNNSKLLFFPLILGSLSIFSTLIGNFFVKLKGNDVIYALYKGLFVSSFFSLFFIYLFVKFSLGWDCIYSFSFFKIFGKNFFYCSFIGIFLTIILVFITEYYTSTKYFPVREIARVSVQGHAPNIIQGLAVSMEATTLPVFAVIVAILISYYIAGIIGIAVAATSMVSLSGMIVALDAYGPVTDNAGGIAEMSKLSEEVRVKTDILDAVGNTTKAITKGYAIGSAGLGSLVLFVTYTEDLRFYFDGLNLEFSLKDPYVISGLFFGGIIPYLFSSFSMRAVGNVASKVVEEVRIQFLNVNNSSIFKPDYNKVVDLLTKESIKEMIIPSILPVFLPIFFYIFIFLFFGNDNAFVSLGAMLLGTIIIGIFLAISMTSGGGAWDNAKKFIEDGNLGGKGSFAHKSSITGDMVGDPYKDTAGPAINPLIKVVNLVSLLMIIIIAKI